MSFFFRALEEERTGGKKEKTKKTHRGPALPDAVDPPHRLRLRGRVEPRLQEDNVLRLGQVEPSGALLGRQQQLWPFRQFLYIAKVELLRRTDLGMKQVSCSWPTMA